jgi:hypothetical protein
VSIEAFGSLSDEFNKSTRALLKPGVEYANAWQPEAFNKFTLPHVGGKRESLRLARLHD